MSAPNRTRRTVHGLIWSLSGTGSRVVLQIVVTIALTHFLPPADFGIVAAALVVVNLSLVMSQIGLAPALIQREELTDEHVHTGFVAASAIGIAFAMLVWISAPWIARFFGIDEVAPALRILSVLFLIHGIGSVSKALLERELEFRKLAVANLVSFALGYGAVALSLGWAGFGYNALVFGMIGQAVVSTILYLRWQRPRGRLSPTAWALKDLLSFGVGFSGARLASYAALNLDNLIVGKLLGAESLGVYDRAYKLTSVPATHLGTAMVSVLFPTMARAWGNKEPGMHKAYSRTLLLLSVTTLPASGVLVLVAPELVGVFLGDAWGAVVLPLQVLGLGVCGRMIHKLNDALANGAGAVYDRAWRQAMYAAMIAGGALAGVAYGPVGVAAGVVVAIYLHVAVGSQLSKRLVGLTWAEVAAALAPAVRTTAIVVALTWAGKLAAENLGFDAVGVLAAVLGLAASFALFAGYFKPPLLLGRDGRQVASRLQTHILEIVRSGGAAR